MDNCVCGHEKIDHIAIKGLDGRPCLDPTDYQGNGCPCGDYTPQEG